MDDAFEFVIENNGVDTEEDYPYKGSDGSCNKKKVFNSLEKRCFNGTGALFSYIVTVALFFVIRFS